MGMAVIEMTCLWTGQQTCHNTEGEEIECTGSGQDAEFKTGLAWPQSRFTIKGELVEDQLTGLLWTQKSNFAGFPLSWQDSPDFVANMNRQKQFGFNDWRLPTINELESLVDCSRAKPALVGDELFKDVKDVYWPSTTSLYEPDWAMALYVDKGAVGVGQKWLPHFYVWPVFTKD